MKAGLLIESAEPGGAEEVVLRLATGLRARGQDSVVLTLESGWLTRALADRGQPAVLLSSRRRLDAALPVRIARRIRREGIELLHSHLLDSTFYGAIAARIAGVPHLATDHGDVHLPKAKPFVRTKLRVASLLGTRFTAVSRFTAARLRELGVPDRRIVLLPNPIAPAPTADRERLRASFGIPADRGRHWIWIHAGMLREVKDQSTLLRGFAVARQGSPVEQTLLIAGEGPDRPVLESLARQLGLGAGVVFLGFRDDLDQLLQAADGFVLTSRSEALPMSLLEAAAAGLLLVSSDVGGVSDIVEHDVSGFLFAAGDPAALGRTLARAVADVPGSRTIACRARDSVLARFAEDRVMDAYVELCAALRSGARSAIDEQAS